MRCPTRLGREVTQLTGILLGVRRGQALDFQIPAMRALGDGFARGGTGGLTLVPSGTCRGLREVTRRTTTIFSISCHATARPR
jgi:hypothetical protein